MIIKETMTLELRRVLKTIQNQAQQALEGGHDGSCWTAEKCWNDILEVVESDDPLDDEINF